MKRFNISDERLIAALVAAAKRDDRSLTNFIVRMIEKAQPYWEKEDWDKAYFGGSGNGVSGSNRLSGGDIQEIKLCLCPIEKKALSQWQKRRFTKGNIAHVAHFFMWFACLHAEQFDRWAEAFARYTFAEDLDQFEYGRRRLAMRYRTQKLKLTNV